MFFTLEKPYIYKLLAIDPGGKKTGVSIFHINLDTRKIEKIETWTILVEKLHDDTGLPVELIGEKFHRYYRLRNEFLRILKRVNVDAVAYEGPFMNVKQPTAFGPLVSVMTLIMDALFSYNPGIPFHVIQPQQTKKGVGVAGKKGKEIMLEAVKKIVDIADALKNGNVVLDDLDDNGVDSVAVGVYVVNEHILPEKDYAKYLPTR